MHLRYVDDVTDIAAVAAREFGDDEAVNAGATIVGTSIHSFFDGDSFRHALLDAARAAVGLATATTSVNWSADRERRLDAWAAHVRAHLDRELIAR